MPGGAEITLVEGDTYFDLLLAFSDAHAYFPVTNATSLTLEVNTASIPLTSIPSVGYAHTTDISDLTLSAGHHHGKVTVVLDGMDQIFPSEAPVFIEVLPHTRART